MTWRTVCNQTSMNLTRSVRSWDNETQQDPSIAVVENSPNWLGFATVADDGTPIVYKASEYRPCGTDQYNPNPTP